MKRRWWTAARSEAPTASCEQRYVISTPLRIGDREWPIEVTLTNRDTMVYRMLLGRQAIIEGVLVDPSASFRQPRLRYKVYDAPARR